MTGLQLLTWQLKQVQNGIFEVDEKTIEYVKQHSTKPYKIFKADEDAEYSEVYEIDISKISQQLHFHIFLRTQRQLMR